MNQSKYLHSYLLHFPPTLSISGLNARFLILIVQLSYQTMDIFSLMVPMIQIDMCHYQ